MALFKYLTTQNYDVAQEHIFCKVDSGTQFAHLGTEDGGVTREKGVGQVLCPVYDWQAAGVVEDDVIARVLTEAAQANVLKLASTSDVGPQLWAKLRGTRAILINPAMMGTFRMPLDLDVVRSEKVAAGQIIALGPSGILGYYVKQGHRRNVVAHCKRGLTAVQFHQPTKPNLDLEL